MIFKTMAGRNNVAVIFKDLFSQNSYKRCSRLAVLGLMATLESSSSEWRGTNSHKETEQN